MRVKAVIFDLWETLIDWDRDSAARMLREVDALVGNGFAERWDRSNRRYVAPIRTALAEAEVPAELIEDICSPATTVARWCRAPAPSRRSAGCVRTATSSD
jgi:FMN phosphatase YigB (HAD superfamily)